MNSELVMIATKDRDTPISLSFILGNKEMA